MFCVKHIIRTIPTRKFLLYQKRYKYYFVTTPIFYVNASPHIGHLYSALIADAMHRYHRLLGCEQTLFATGTDEHGTKIQEAASRAGCHIPDYCDQISRQYHELFHAFEVEYTDFVRTTQQRHKTAVHHFWETLRSRGHIYKGTYSGWYCVPEESFLTEDQLKEARGDDGKPRKVSAETGHPVEWMEETNYMFRLSALQGELLSWLKTEPVRPARFQQQLLAWVGGPSALRDVSVSRPSSRVHWGVPVPGDHGQTVYVWLDALVNYLTAAGYPGEPLPGHWPPSLHVIGKDILKFHGIYWPAFLISAGLEPPQAILCHSHWTVDGEKMSKSRGNVINPLGCAEVFTASGLRYFLLREGTPHSDANYSETKVMRVLNSELADTLGNLLSRSCARAVNPAQVFPGYDTSLLPSLCGSEGQQLLESLAHLPDAVAKHYEECAFYRGVDVIMGTLRLANRLFEVQRPWELAKCGGDNERLRCTLHLAMEALRVCGIALQPVAPSLAGRVLDKLGVPAERRCWADMQTCADQDAAIGKQQVILYQRVLSGR